MRARARVRGRGRLPCRPRPDFGAVEIERGAALRGSMAEHLAVRCMYAGGGYATLRISTRTVEVHVAAVFDRAGCDSRASLIAMLWT